LSEQGTLYKRTSHLRRVVLVAGAVNLAGTLAKVVYGELTRSAAMSADGLHSGLDTVASGIALIGISLAARPPDPRHPYGYERYESIAALVIGGCLVLALVHIGREALSRLRQPVAVEVTWISIALMAGSMLASGGLAWWEHRQGKRLGSELLHADAAHTSSDVLASLAVLAGLAAAAHGWTLVDTLVAVVVVGVIARAAWGILRTATNVLTDAAMVDVGVIAAVAVGVPGVVDCHAVRARGPAGRVRVDLHLHVDPAMRVAEAHALTQTVARAVQCQVAGVVEVLVHVGPADIHQPRRQEQSSRQG
jgi:cation diffusion facilitator family transporter